MVNHVPYHHGYRDARDGGQRQDGRHGRGRQLAGGNHLRVARGDRGGQEEGQG